MSVFAIFAAINLGYNYGLNNGILSTGTGFLLSLFICFVVVMWAGEIFFGEY